MAIKVYGSLLSPPVLRVVTTLEEKEMDYEFVPVNMQAGEHKKESFLSLNPFGQVPAFEDGDLKLFESRAITQYIAHTYVDKGTNLIIQDHKKMTIMSVWMEVESHKFDPVASKLGYEIAKPILGKTTDEALVTQYAEELGKVLDVYEIRLNQSKYLGGECFTLVDLHHIPFINYFMNTPRVKVVFDARPKVSAWCADILARPAWSKVDNLAKPVWSKAQESLKH